MARLVATATGNLSAAIWAVCDAASALDSEAATVNVPTTPTNSSSFTPAAVAIDAVLVKVATKATGGGAVTITMSLRNVTTTTDVATVTMNVVDIPDSATGTRDTGWLQFKLGASHTPNGTDTYAVRMSVSASSPVVTLYRDATANNWSRLLRTTTVQAPAAGDQFIIAKEHTGAGTNNGTYTITMNSTTATQYGTTTGLSSTHLANAAVSICDGCSVVWANAAATNYIWRMAGSLVIHRGGTMTMGTAAAKIPRDSTASLEFVTTASVDSGLWVCNGATFKAYGLSRTSGKDVSWTLLTDDAAAAATVLTVAADTGWLNGDEIGIAPTAQTITQGERRTLNANATATGLSISVGLTNTHLGAAANDMQAEVVLLTRNVKIRTSHSTATLGTFVNSLETATFEAEWVEFFNLGSSQTDRRGIHSEAGADGSYLLNYCSIWGDTTLGNGWYWLGLTTTGGNFTMTNNVVYRPSSTGSGIEVAALTSTNYTVNGNVIARNSGVGFQLFDVGGSISNNRAAGCNGNGFSTSAAAEVFGTFSGNISHSNSQIGFLLNNLFPDNGSAPAMVAWRNGGTGIQVTFGSATTSWVDGTWDGVRAWGNVTQNVWLRSWCINCLFKNWVVAGDTSFATGNGIVGDANVVYEIRWENCVFGGGGGTKTTHSTTDINIQSGALFRYVFSDCQLLSTTELLGTGRLGSIFSFGRKDSTAGSHETFFGGRGTIATDTTLYKTDSPSEKLLPSSATYSLRSSPIRAAVNNATTITFSVWVRKNSSYNGSFQPRLILRSNPALGIDNNVTLDTLSVAADTWEQLTGTSASVTDDGVLEAYVEVNGTAGQVNVDDWTVT